MYPPAAPRRQGQGSASGRTTVLSGDRWSGGEKPGRGRECVQRAGRAGVQGAGWSCSGPQRRKRYLQETTQPGLQSGRWVKQGGEAATEEEMVKVLENPEWHRGRTREGDLEQNAWVFHDGGREPGGRGRKEMMM